jgi:hypothetical protein
MGSQLYAMYETKIGLIFKRRNLSPWSGRTLLFTGYEHKTAHACNPSYSGSREQEDRGSKPVPANCFRDPISKNPVQKRGSGVAPGVGPEFKSWYRKTKKHVGSIFI